MSRVIGLVGYNCASGLGVQNRQMCDHVDITRWLVKPHPQFPTLEPHPLVDTQVCIEGSTKKLNEFVRSVDTILFVETPYYPHLLDFCKEHGKRTVCIPNQEWMPAEGKGWPELVDLFICPTYHCYSEFRKLLPCVYFPWPVDTDKFRFRIRDYCHKFLFLNGHGGTKGRKGAHVVTGAKYLWPHMPLLVRTQVEYAWPPGTTMLPEVAEQADLYSVGDVLIVPHSVDGLGLELGEAMASGMPVISTNGEPWNEVPSIGKIQAERSTKVIRRPVTWYEPDYSNLVEICKSLLNRPIDEESYVARSWAESRSWNHCKGPFTDLVRYGVAG